MATGLLCCMGGIYTGSLFVAEPGFGVLLLRAAAEAGVIGGLADWFAVTALFRHPMGLPIPHTAIVPASQQRIGKALGHFVERNFLTRELILRKARDLRVGEAVARWLADPRTPALLSGWLAAGVPPIIRTMESSELHAFAERAIGEQLRRANLAPTLGRLLKALVTTPEADRLIDGAIAAASTWLDENRAELLDSVQARSRWWMPKAIDRSIARTMADGLGELLERARAPDSELRARVRAMLLTLAEELVTSEDRSRQVEAAKRRLLASPAFTAWLGALWREASNGTLSDLANPSSSTRAVLERALVSAGRVLSKDPSMVAQIDRLAEKAALVLVTRRQYVAGIVSEVVGGWDAHTLTRRLELAVGSDLQYIRVSGTLVGAAAGCALFLLTRLLGLPH